MASVKQKTKFLGVRYREHPTRKHGVNYDRCFFVRYKLKGKDKEEAAGWASEGITAEKAFMILADVRENIRSGAGPQSLADMKAVNEEKAMQAQVTARQAERQAINLMAFWEREYLPHAESTKKLSSMTSERFLYRKWILPSLGDVPLMRINSAMVEKIVMTMKKQGKSAASIRYMLAVISQIWGLAVSRDIVQGDSPTKKVKKPRADNRRMRFLTHEEARTLLDALALRSQDMHDAALLSLFAGLRAGEIHALTWGDVDMDTGTLYIKDPKNKHSRHAFMTQEVRTMLQGRYDQQHKTALIFPARGGGKRVYVPDTFERTVRDLGFNGTGECDADGKPLEILDARQRVVFHTLRHTFASWLVQAGTPIYTLAQLMGHADMKMTQRYSHLAPDNMQQATMMLQGALDAPKSATVLTFRKTAGQE